jgi:hypothetical protein
VAALRPFRAWDGEGAEHDEPGQPQRYVLLASDDHPHLWRPEGIPTLEALQWLVEHQHASPGIQIAFGTSYDVNMILADLPAEEVAALYMETDWTVELEDQVWRLQWIPGKLFNVRAPDGTWSRTFDTFGFFQCSFVNALTRWGLEVPEYLREMKERRGSFGGGHEWELKAYSELECRLLVELLDKVRGGLREHGLKPRTWHGAGAIASAALRTAGAKEYLGREGRRPLIEDAILRAYFGGRTELFRQGEHASGTQYDINSAYAAALRLLPDSRGNWRRSASWAVEGHWNPWGLWRVSWDIQDEGELLAPLPFRAGRGIFYPTRGEGWYHASEVRTALRHYPDAITVHTGFVFEPATGTKPFEFVEGLYELRQRLSAAGDPVASALKFGLASVWGKLSQSTARDGKVPTYQDYFWSGACTAIVRGWMLDMAAAHRERLIQISTDGLLLDDTDGSVLDDDIGAGLGQLRRTDLQGLLVAQPGMMTAWDAETGEPLAHTRGFFKKEIDFEKLRAEWRRNGPRGSLATSGIRFYGIGTCMAQGTFADWRKWKRHRQVLSLHSSRKYYAQLGGHAGGSYLLLPPIEVRPGLSGPYEPKVNLMEILAEHTEWIQGNEQPMVAF